jgi:hypothetical protein
MYKTSVKRKNHAVFWSLQNGPAICGMAVWTSGVHMVQNYLHLTAGITQSEM